MGPTEIKPKTQYFGKKIENAEFIPLTCEAGSVILIHYDIEHRGGHNRSNQDRLMFKFQFNRLEEPLKPSWDCKDTNWDGKEAGPLMPICRSIWNWMTGNNLQVVINDRVDIIEWIKKLNKSEPEKYQAAFMLASLGKKEKLIKSIQKVHCAHALCICGESVVPKLIEILKNEKQEGIHYVVAFILSEIGVRAQKSLLALIESYQYVILKKDSYIYTRKPSKLSKKDLYIKHIYIAEALGNLGREENIYSKEINSCLIDMLRNSQDDHVRFTAALALARLGPLAKESVPALVEALEDENRYVVGNALLALERINTQESIQVLLKYLKCMRWDPKTSEESQY